MSETSFGGELRRLAAVDQHRPALTFLDQTLTRAELAERTDRLAAHFAQLGVTLGSTVTIGLPNSCTSQGKQDYTDGVFTGRMEIYAECAGVGTSMALLFASQADGQTIFLGLQLTAEDDPAIADEISGSFLIIG